MTTLQEKCAEAVTDEAFASAAERFPNNPPQTKEEYYYRELFEVCGTRARVRTSSRPSQRLTILIK